LISTGGLVNAHATDPNFEFGDYDLMDFNNGVFYRSWTDNTLPGHVGMDLATAPVTVTVTPEAGSAGRFSSTGDVLAPGSSGLGTLTMSAPPVAGLASNISEAGIVVGGESWSAARNKSAKYHGRWD
jgi:hypothetical protein